MSCSPHSLLAIAQPDGIYSPPQDYTMLSIYSCCHWTVKGGHWTSNPDTSHAGDSESRKPAPAHRRHRHHRGRSRRLYLSWHIYNTHTQIPTIGSAGARHAIKTQPQSGDKPPHCEAELCCGRSGMSTTQPWRENEAQEREEKSRVEEKALCSSQQLRGGAKLRCLHWDNR